jgi:ribosomal protein S18 acetylase RimI-like enzyme
MSKNECMIQLCHANDAPRIAPLIQALAIEEGAEPADIADITHIVAALLQSGASDFLLVTIADEPVGCLQIAYRLSTWQALPYAYLEDFYLAPSARRRGIGAKLLDYALQRAEGQKCDAAILDVRTTNTAAQRLYQRLGFTRSRRILMQRPLPLGESYCDTTATLAAIEELRGNEQASEVQ